MGILSDHIDDVIDSLFEDAEDPEALADMVRRAVDRHDPPRQGDCILTEADILAGRDDDCTTHEHEA